MRLVLCLFLGVLAVPALADTGVQIIAATPEAQADADALGAALTDALAPGGDRADCPVVLSATGEILASVAHDPGPPPGWTLALGPTDNPLATVSGPAGDVSAATLAILENLCPRIGGDGAYAGPWTASGGGNGTVVTGMVQSVSQIFTLECSFPGGTCVFRYVPFGGGGIVEGHLQGGGATAFVEGLYSLTRLPGDVYVIEQTTSGCVDGVPNSCRTNDHTITLTPFGS
ncbi:MAG: hypothetical protein KIT76_07985 [Pseudolabrys sp.]|nr:hypothetical protein [Pseudolabrys sp.]MCW5696157.1 hypothetical protein [Bauldia sp.]